MLLVINKIRALSRHCLQWQSPMSFPHIAGYNSSQEGSFWQEPTKTCQERQQKQWRLWQLRNKWNSKWTVTCEFNYINAYWIITDKRSRLKSRKLTQSFNSLVDQLINLVLYTLADIFLLFHRNHPIQFMHAWFFNILVYLLFVFVWNHCNQG